MNMDYWVKSVTLLVGLVSVVESLGELYEQLEKSKSEVLNNYIIQTRFTNLFKHSIL